jgi:WD40 repeat protein
VGISSKGEQFLTGSNQGVLAVWSLAHEEELARFTAEDSLRCCVFSVEGNVIVAGERSGRVHFLRLET